MASVSADCLPGSHATLSAFVLSCVFWQINTYTRQLQAQRVSRVILPALFATRETRSVGDRPTPPCQNIPTVKYRNSFIPYCLSKFDCVCVPGHIFSACTVYNCIKCYNPASGCYMIINNVHSTDHIQWLGGVVVRTLD